MKYIIYFLVIILGFNYCNVISQNKTNTINSNQVTTDTTANKPYFSIDTTYFKVPKPEGKFITKKISFYNSGKSLLLIDKIHGSCGCATSTILNSKINPGDTGKIMLYINLSNFDEKAHLVYYNIYSNAFNSPLRVSVDVIMPHIDSINVKK